MTKQNVCEQTSRHPVRTTWKHEKSITARSECAFTTPSGNNIYIYIVSIIHNTADHKHRTRIWTTNLSYPKLSILIVHLSQFAIYSPFKFLFFLLEGRWTRYNFKLTAKSVLKFEAKNYIHTMKSYRLNYDRINSTCLWISMIDVYLTKFIYK